MDTKEIRVKEGSFSLEDVPSAIEQEHRLTFWHALRSYKKAVFWSLLISTTIVMEGYDTMLIGNLIGQPQFQKRYGTPTKKHKYQVSAPWQAGLGNGSTCGQLIGLLLAGYTTERFGFRKTMLLGLATITGIIFMQFFAPNLTVLLVAQILFGIPLGLFQTTAVVYAHEVAPVTLQGYLTVYINICWGIGHLIGAGILRGCLSINSEYAYKLPFAIQWIWPAILIPTIFFSPESPWWQVRMGKIGDAKATLQRLMSKQASSEDDMAKQISLMVYTTQHERQIKAESSYRACFKGIDLKRTMIVVGIYVTQTLCGNTLRSSSTYFLEQAGMPTTQAFNMTLVSYAIAVVGGLAMWILLPRMGRRPVYFWSLVIMTAILAIIGGLGVGQDHSKDTSLPYAIGSLLIISSFLYNVAMGPLTNTLCASIPSSLLRSKSVALARWFYAVSGIVAGTIQPYMNNPTAWNWGAKSGFFWAGTCLLSTIFAYFYVPETKDLTTAEMDIFYEERLSTRASTAHLIKDISPNQ